MTLPTWRDSCFIENCAFGYVLHSLHKLKFPCVPRYFLFFKLNSSFPMLYAKYLWRRFGHGREQFRISDKSSVSHLNLSLANFYIRRCNTFDLTGKTSVLLALHNRTKKPCTVTVERIRPNSHLLSPVPIKFSLGFAQFLA